MRCFVLVMAICLGLVVPAEAGQPAGVVLSRNGISTILPVLDTAGWVLTQPQASRLYTLKDKTRLTHWGDEYYAQDWARGCGQTFGQRVYAGISGRIVWAGARGPYGHTVVIYDPESRFALKYSHLSDITVTAGEYVLAGMSLVGRIGNSGNVSTGGCSEHAGAHLHLSLFKDVSDPVLRPISTTSATIGSGPTVFAAPFGYAAGQELAKSPNGPAIYVLYYGTKVLLSSTAYESNGWNFDKHESVFKSFKVRFDLDKFPTANYIWPMREDTLLKANGNQTVYQFQDYRKKALSFETFQCRLLRFNEIREVSGSETLQYLPQHAQEAKGCVPVLKIALKDLTYNAVSLGLGQPDLSGYGVYPDWDQFFELRWLTFKHPSGKVTTLYHASLINNPEERFIAYHDPFTNQWSGWQRVY